MNAVPDEIRDLADRRSEARRRRDWAEADRLRAEIEAAGWKIVDSGRASTLEPAHPRDRLVDGRLRYGSAESVPSMLERPPDAPATIVLASSRDAPLADSAARAVLARSPAGTQLVVVADDPSGDVAASLERLATGPVEERDDVPGGSVSDRSLELVLTGAPLGVAETLDAGIRRARGSLVILLDGRLAPAGDVVTPLAETLDDPAVALSGASGIVTTDLRHLAESIGPEADAVGLGLLAFRRSDYVERGPLDRRLRTRRYLALWWGLVLRDEGAGRTPRRAVVIPGIGGTRGLGGLDDGGEDGERDRLERRDYYRVLDRFRGRQDLLGATPSSSDRAGDPPVS